MSSYYATKKHMHTYGINNHKIINTPTPLFPILKVGFVSAVILFLYWYSY